jgi:lipopolysaccharide biosynthesis regulator YciM
VLDWRLFVVLFLAIAFGYFMGRRSSSRDEDDFSGSSLEPHYIKGLNYFLNDQPDEAIDTFISALDVNSETLETHLALGSLLRKRGEVGRAIKIHQNLLARPGLPEARSQQVQLELARDYMKSGLLDRAEVLLQELSEITTGLMKINCLQHLIEIYRDEKEWLKGIEAVSRLSSKRFYRLSEEWRIVQSHFYCELAQRSLTKTEYLDCRKYIKAAMAADKGSVRASLILAELEERLGQYREAIKSLKQVPFQDPEFMPEIIPRLVNCYKQQGNEQELKVVLEGLLESHSNSAVVLALAEIMARHNNKAESIQFIADHVESIPTLNVVRAMLSLQLESENQNLSLGMAEAAVSNLQKHRPRYRCYSCGFGGKQMHWLCPGCKSWGTVKPTE